MLDFKKRIKKYYCNLYEYSLFSILAVVPGLIISAEFYLLLKKDDSFFISIIIWGTPIALITFILFRKFKNTIHNLFSWNKTKVGFVHYFVSFILLYAFLFRFGVLTFMFIGLIITYGVPTVIDESFSDIWRTTLIYTIIEFSIPILTMIYLMIIEVEKEGGSDGDDDEKIVTKYEIKRFERKPVIVTIKGIKN